MFRIVIVYVCFREVWILFCGAIRLLEEGALLAWLDIMNILNLPKDRGYLQVLFRTFIQNNLLNLLVLRRIQGSY